MRSTATSSCVPWRGAVGRRHLGSLWPSRARARRSIYRRPERRHGPAPRQPAAGVQVARRYPRTMASRGRAGMAKVLGWRVDSNWAQEILRAQLVQKLGSERAAWLTPAYAKDGPNILPRDAGPREGGVARRSRLPSARRGAVRPDCARTRHRRANRHRRSGFEQQQPGDLRRAGNPRIGSFCNPEPAR